MDKRSWDAVSDSFMPGMTELAQTIDRQGWVTVAGNQYLDQEVYHASQYYQSFFKPLDCDDFVVSVRIVDVPRGDVRQFRSVGRMARRRSNRTT